MPPDRPDLTGLAARLENAERFVAATGAVVVNGGDRAYYQSPASTSAPASTIKMVFQAQVSWFGPATCPLFFAANAFC
jgi:antirestriction protein ArdC